jgi:predicted ATP-grasp superfamily ATP-dependent carboligase
MPSTIVVAGLWARPLAESARQAGWRVIALDLFGDADTQRASASWSRVGDPTSFALSPGLLRDALLRASRERDVVGWVAGSGFEALPDALDQHLPGLPLLGMDALSVRAVRDPARFFSTLDALGLAHPEVSLRPPADPHGWLVKNAAGSGGWHIRRATDVSGAGAGSCYWQRLQAGEPMSALFLADGMQARLVALNHLVVRPLGALPHVFHGAVGPVRDDALARAVEDALSRLVPAFALRGLASLDFLAHAGSTWLLEVNPRPSATMVLYPDAWPDGLLRAHVDAVQGRLPAVAPLHPPGVRGCLTVFAEEPCRVGLGLAAELARSADCHDLPPPGARFVCGDPVCSVSAEAELADAVLAAMDARVARLRAELRPCEEIAA